MSISEVYNIDCMEYMKNTPDKYFELAIVDPEYGIKINKQSLGKGGGVAKHNEYIKKDWDQKPPQKKYFDELRRISKNQIIWGGNYFLYALKETPCFVVWDKENGLTDFADCELAWTSFKSSVRIFKFKWSGMLQCNMKNKEIRIHPTQKPVELYKWLLNNYAKIGDKIFDSHLGSGSNRIAAYELGFDFYGCELDKDYFEAQEERFKVFKMGLENKFYIPDDENYLFKGLI